MSRQFKRRIGHSHREAWDYGLPDAYDKLWLTDVTASECQHAGSLGKAAGDTRRITNPRAVGFSKLQHSVDDLPPLMGHNYQSRTTRSPTDLETEVRCQKCGVLWEENRADPRWCRALGGVT